MGYRGTGKSTVAELVAAELDYPWADSDTFVEQEAGRTIAEIFAEDGEAAFRRLEADAVLELVQRPALVLALGGGAVLRESTAQVLSQAGPVIWLTCDPEVLVKRISQDPASGARRPQLTAVGGREEIRNLLAERAPIYRKWARYEVETTHRSPAQVADQIVDYVQSCSRG